MGTQLNPYLSFRDTAREAMHDLRDPLDGMRAAGSRA